MNEIEKIGENKRSKERFAQEIMGSYFASRNRLPLYVFFPEGNLQDNVEISNLSKDKRILEIEETKKNFFNFLRQKLDNSKSARVP